jgi:signal transduction histidine kinase
MFILGTAVILLFALVTSSVMEITFLKLEKIIIGTEDTTGFYWVLVFIATSVILGVLLALLLGRMIFKPVNDIVDGMTKLADGDYSTRIQLGQYEGMKTLADRFNALAEELENTEMLRSDFINEFSHEMNTPLLSITGLIKLMKSENLSEEKRNQYLAIMEEEADRLSHMTSNSLYLSKIESQGILTNKKRFNLSEQIRSSVLLLEKKWTEKALIPVLDFEEYTIRANEDMLKQVWVNLIDNAIKFSSDGKELIISISENEGKIEIKVENYGIEIPESEYSAIFNKFYQCEKSRSTNGNGIGLSIVKQIITLHSGDISVKSENGKTTFTVTLPKQ